MAGSYSDVPGPSIRYEDDGSAAFTLVSGALTTATTAQRGYIQDETIAVGWGNVATTSITGVVFPCTYDVVGWVLVSDYGSDQTIGKVETSTDTTNGQDGSWTTQTSSATFCGLTAPGLIGARTAINSVTYSGIRGIRFSKASGGSNGVRLLHLFGSSTTAGNPDSLRFWHPTNNVAASGPELDFGDCKASQTKVLTFRLKNISATKQANSVTVAASALTAMSPTLASQTTFSTDNSNWSSSLSLGNIAANTVTSVLYMRVVASSSPQLGWGRQAVKASASSWT